MSQRGDAMDIEDEAPVAFTQSLLPFYYANLFPYEAMYQWLSYQDPSFFGHREWSFTKDSIYTRYNSFDSCKDFRDHIRRKCPDKLDIGAVFDTKPTDHQKVEHFKPKEKELVFDIDATDYKDVFVTPEKTDELTCVTWPVMCVTVQVLDYLLRNDFGFKHIMWVYSGRRGVHCWVSDPRAKKLSNAARSAVAEYLQVITGGEDKKLQLPLTLHPSLNDVYHTILLPSFVDYFVKREDIFNNASHTQRILELVPEVVREIAMQDWKGKGDSLARWDSLVKTISEKHMPKFTNPIQNIVFTYLYPRLDINVSKQLNHLLKSPFAVHPSTGRICVPFLASEAKQFRPEEVPTVASIMAEINKSTKSAQDIQATLKNTKLAKPYEILDNFVSELPKQDPDWNAVEK